MYIRRNAIYNKELFSESTLNLLSSILPPFEFEDATGHDTLSMLYEVAPSSAILSPNQLVDIAGAIDVMSNVRMEKQAITGDISPAALGLTASWGRVMLTDLVNDQFRTRRNIIEDDVILAKSKHFEVPLELTARNIESTSATLAKLAMFRLRRELLYEVLSTLRAGGRHISDLATLLRKSADLRLNLSELPDAIALVLFPEHIIPLRLMNNDLRAIIRHAKTKFHPITPEFHILDPSPTTGTITRVLRSGWRSNIILENDIAPKYLLAGQPSMRDLTFTETSTGLHGVSIADLEDWAAYISSNTNIAGAAIVVGSALGEYAVSIDAQISTAPQPFTVPGSTPYEKVINLVLPEAPNCTINRVTHDVLTGAGLLGNFETTVAASGSPLPQVDDELIQLQDPVSMAQLAYKGSRIFRIKYDGTSEVAKPFNKLHDTIKTWMIGSYITGPMVGGVPGIVQEIFRLESDAYAIPHQVVGFMKFKAKPFGVCNHHAMIGMVFKDDLVAWEYYDLADVLTSRQPSPNQWANCQMILDPTDTVDISWLGLNKDAFDHSYLVAQGGATANSKTMKIPTSLVAELTAIVVRKYHVFVDYPLQHLNARGIRARVYRVGDTLFIEGVHIVDESDLANVLVTSRANGTSAGAVPAAMISTLRSKVNDPLRTEGFARKNVYGAEFTVPPTFRSTIQAESVPPIRMRYVKDDRVNDDNPLPIGMLGTETERLELRTRPDEADFIITDIKITESVAKPSDLDIDGTGRSSATSAVVDKSKGSGGGGKKKKTTNTEVKSEDKDQADKSAQATDWLEEPKESADGDVKEDGEDEDSK